MPEFFPDLLAGRDFFIPSQHYSEDQLSTQNISQPHAAQGYINSEIEPELDSEIEPSLRALDMSSHTELAFIFANRWPSSAELDKIKPNKAEMPAIVPPITKLSPVSEVTRAEPDSNTERLPKLTTVM